MQTSPPIGLPEVELAVDAIRVMDHELQVDYVLANRSGEPVFALDLLVARFGQLDRRASNPRPDATKLEPGAVFAATLRARLPLVEWSEAWMPMRDAPENVDVAIARIRLQVEWIRAAAVTHLRALDTAPGCWAVSGSRSHVLEVEHGVDLGITLLAHSNMLRFG